MDQLHAVDPQFSKTQAPTTSAHTRRNKLRQRGNRRKGGAGKAPAAGGAEAGREEGVQDQEGEGEDDGGAAASGPTAATWAGMDAASLTWQCVLWQRALQHANLQVQKLGLQSFLQRAWAPRPGSEPDTAPPGARCHSEVPVIFVAEVLIPALAKDIHYRGATGNMDLQVKIRDFDFDLGCWIHNSLPCQLVGSPSLWWSACLHGAGYFYFSCCCCCCLG